MSRTSSHPNGSFAEFSNSEVLFGSNDSLLDDPSTVEPDPLIGRVLAGRYRVDELIASGGMGAVYRGLHLTMRKRVAIKVLHPRLENFPHLVARFEREAVAGAHVQHPNVASATDFAELEDGSYFLVLEYVEGVTLARILEQGSLPPARAAHIGRQVASALSAVHAMGILHRDVKPRNIMLVEGQSDRVKLIDFGIAKVPIEEIAPSSRNGQVPAGAKLTAQGAMLGSPPYMAPETALGMDGVDERADLYSLGIVLYKMLTGLHPFDADCDVDYILHNRSTQPPPMRVRARGIAVPAELEAITMRLLAKDPRARFSSAKALLDAIDAALPSIEKDAPPIPWRSALPQWVLGAPSVRPPGSVNGGGNESRGGSQDSGTDETTAPVIDDETTVPRPEERLSFDRGIPATAITTGASAAVTREARRSARRRRWGLWVLGLWTASVVVTMLLFWRARHAHEQAPQGAKHASRDAPSAEQTAVPPLAPAQAPATGNATPAVASAAVAAAPALAPAEAEALRRRLVAATSAKNPEIAADALLAIINTDPVSFELRDVRRAAAIAAALLEQTKHPARDRVFDALANELGPHGLDVLYDLESSRGGTAAADRAAKTLRRPEVLERASPALRVAIALRDAACPDKPALFDRAGADGDDRTLALLELYRAPPCKPQSGQCCFGASDALKQAMDELRNKRAAR